MSSVIHKVKCSQQAISMFNMQIQQFGLTETGGVLIGHIENGILIIEKASDPGPNAIHEATYFRADANYIDMFVDMEVANSGGSHYYLGEWHTHPEKEPEPSPLDVESLSEIAISSDEFAILLIVGAVNFTKEAFKKQHILLIKYKNDRTFYSLSIDV